MFVNVVVSGFDRGGKNAPSFVESYTFYTVYCNVLKKKKIDEFFINVRTAADTPARQQCSFMAAGRFLIFLRTIEYCTTRVV